jgi:hypothetical protein
MYDKHFLLVFFGTVSVLRNLLIIFDARILARIGRRSVDRLDLVRSIGCSQPEVNLLVHQ